MADDTLTPDEVAEIRENAASGNLYMTITAKPKRTYDGDATATTEGVSMAYAGVVALCDTVDALREQLREAKPALLRVAAQLSQIGYAAKYPTQARADAAALRALVEMEVSDE